MSKIHKKTLSTCIVCDESYEKGCVLHKTRRQTHSMCLDCIVGYLKPVLRRSCNNVRKNIRNNVGYFKCPGTYHCESRNQCKNNIHIGKIKVPDCDISLDIFRLVYVLNTPTAYMCPEEKCGQVIDVDEEYMYHNLQCNDCKLTWCRQCMVSPYHEGKSCVEYEVENSSSENSQYIRDMNKKGLLKFCPTCRAPTYKNTGCNKMICFSCGSRWCWLCCASDIDYDHYNINNKGRCVGKLWEGVDEDGNAIDLHV